MNWKFWKRQKQSNVKSVAEVVQAKNQIITDRSAAVNALSTRSDLNPKERFELLLKTYRHGKDLIVVPEAWRDYPMVAAFSGKKVFVDTPWPSIVRTH